MKTTTLAVALAALLTLTACGGNNDDAEADAPTTFANIDELNTHIADKYSGTAKLNGGTEIMMSVESKNTELQDQDRTLKVLEEVGTGAEFDYNTVSIGSKPDKGEWGYRYAHDVVQDIANASVGDGSIVVTEIWDKAEHGYNTAY